MEDPRLGVVLASNLGYRVPGSPKIGVGSLVLKLTRGVHLCLIRQENRACAGVCQGGRHMVASQQIADRAVRGNERRRSLGALDKMRLGWAWVARRLGIGRWWRPLGRVISDDVGKSVSVEI